MSQLSPAQLGKEGNSWGGGGGRGILGSIFTLQNVKQILGLHLKTHPFQLAELAPMKFSPASPPRQLAGMCVLNTASASVGILNNYTLK